MIDVYAPNDLLPSGSDRRIGEALTRAALRAHDVAETTLIPRAPRGREEVPAHISRLLHAHEIVLKEARAMARRAAEAGDDGTNDLIVSDVIRRNELQVWFVAEHVINAPIIETT